MPREKARRGGKGETAFLGVHARLVFPDPEDEKAVLDLMRRFSSATRFAYKRLLQGRPREEFKTTPTRIGAEATPSWPS
jgi:hypothetical protein